MPDRRPQLRQAERDQLREAAVRALLLGHGPSDVARWLVALGPRAVGLRVADRIVAEARGIARAAIRNMASADLDPATVAALDEQIARANQRAAA